MSAEDIEYIGDYKEFPTKESALDWLDNYLSLDERNNLIRALQQPILDKIRAEIDRQYKWLINTSYTIRDVDIAFGSIFRIIDKYKAESEVNNGKKKM